MWPASMKVACTPTATSKWDRTGVAAEESHVAACKGSPPTSCQCKIPFQISCAVSADQNRFRSSGSMTPSSTRKTSTRHPPWRGYRRRDHQRHYWRVGAPLGYQARSRRWPLGRRMGEPLGRRMGRPLGQALVAALWIRLAQAIVDTIREPLLVLDQDSYETIRGRRAGNIRLRIAFLSWGTPDYAYETLQSLPWSTWFNCASEVDASVLLKVVQEGVRT